MFKKFAYTFLFLVFSTEVFSEHEDQGKYDYVFPYLMRAIDPQGNSALFVATQHEYPWDAVPEWFKEQILSRNVAVFEEIGDEQQEDEALRLFSKESLPPEVFLPEEESWEFPSFHEEFQDKYSRIAQFLLNLCRNVAMIIAT
jgi:hypothetical protein